MIRQLQINNYKSLHELTLEVGRFNVFIGENGCGKSNLLEVFALVAAAASNKLDNEFLVSRGIRVTEPKLMRSAFSHENLLEPIKIRVSFENLEVIQEYTLINDNRPYTTWTRSEADLSELTTMWMQIKEIEERAPKHHQAEISSVNQKIWDSIAKFFEDNKEDTQNYLEHFEQVVNKIKNFMIYSPESTALRNFDKEGQIEPLGIHGEGLLKLLKVIQNKSPEQRQEIHISLQLFFDWYAELDILKELSPSEDKVSITDRYLTLAFDQRSANEGFLFVLFYIVLMVSDDTPKIFAIDNIDASLNPKLCTTLIKQLVCLAKKYDKQVFVTTHNPAILDGIDLGDDEQRLIVVSRNKQGHTCFRRITLEDKAHSSTHEELTRSESFLSGYLDYAPKEF